MSDEKQLMGIPFGKMKMDDPRTGLSARDIVIWKATHPAGTVKYSEIPTSQEVKDNATESVETETEDVTEESRLRHLLSSFCKAILEYFSAKK